MKKTLSILAATICALAANAETQKVNLSDMTPADFVAAGREGRPIDFVPTPRQFVAEVKMSSIADNSTSITLIGKIYGKRLIQQVLLLDMKVEDAKLLKKVRPIVSDKKRHTVLISLLYEKKVPIVKAIDFLEGVSIEELIPN